MRDRWSALQLTRFRAWVGRQQVGVRLRLEFRPDAEDRQQVRLPFGWALPVLTCALAHCPRQASIVLVRCSCKCNAMLNGPAVSTSLAHLAGVRTSMSRVTKSRVLRSSDGAMLVRGGGYFLALGSTRLDSCGRVADCALWKE